MWLFTMELVEGVPLLEHLRPGGGALQQERLRPAFAQLARGLCALHGAGLVHRDIKPANVLATAAGRVVVLDFGLAKRVEQPEGRGGTAGYMAPEQAAGGAVGPAADWYSVGVMLYEALTGKRPQAKERLPPAAAPADLRALCAALLAADPAQRPGGEEVLRVLGEAQESQEPPVPPIPILGREAELQVLHQALLRAQGGAPVLVLVEGEAGLGKSALLKRFAQEVKEREASGLVLSGRCHEQETVAYRGFDGIMDQLGRHLSGLPAAELAELLPPAAALLAVLFPALGPLGSGASPPKQPGEPAQQRVRAFAVLRSGKTREALLVLQEVLRLARVKAETTPARALVQLLLRRTWLHLRGLRYRERPEAQVAEQDLLQLDTCWTVGWWVNHVSPLMAASLITQHLLLSLQVGEPGCICRAFLAEAGLAAATGGRERHRAERLLKEAQAITQRMPTERLRASLLMSTGVADSWSGEWSRALSVLRQAEELAQAIPGEMAWELGMASWR